MEKVSLDTIKPWISKRVTELLGTDDDVLLEFIVNMLEKEKVTIIPSRSLTNLCKPALQWKLFLNVFSHVSTQTPRRCRSTSLGFSMVKMLEFL
jgi:hypothetical protein